MSDSLRPHGLYSPWNSPGRNTGVGSLSLLQGIFPTQGSNPGLLHCRQILYQLSHKGSPRILEWVAYPFSSGSLPDPVIELGSPALQADYQLSYLGSTRQEFWSELKECSEMLKNYFYPLNRYTLGVTMTMANRAMAQPQLIGSPRLCKA